MMPIMMFQKIQASVGAPPFSEIMASQNSVFLWILAKKQHKSFFFNLRISSPQARISMRVQNVFLINHIWSLVDRDKT